VKTIIAGSRSIRFYHHVERAVALSGFTINEVVSGGAPGVDRLGEQWAAWHGVPIARFPADWELFGKSAGVRRNSQMAKYADALIAVWDGESSGTEHMIDVAEKKGLTVYVHEAR
jgi:SLOG family YspA-like protein